MKLFNFFFLFVTISLYFLSTAYAKESLAFINLDEVIKNSNYGKTILNEIKSLNEKNIRKIKKMETEIKSDENDLNKKKNLLSKEDFENQLYILDKKIIDYQKLIDEINKDFENQKNKNLSIFFSKINPIIQEYMKDESIDILLRQENIFIGNSSADITQIIIKKINNNIN